eukprot:TRINITY_DN4460_c0_g1_i1.p1 TRINITY_DN4460_c0_g1~~TRINITY_DN4460_c0_g1_i1.p1  ORF type:complete len:155 (+),score=38.23 TRINITY_DN4460_c0_g1_i1:19-483(+)
MNAKQWYQRTRACESSKKWKEWEAELAKDPVWMKKRDRFGRVVYFNKDTKQNQQEKPIHWYTQDEKDLEIKKQEEEKKKKLERKRRKEEARIARIKPGLRKIQGNYKRHAEAEIPAAVSKLQNNSNIRYPCLAIVAQPDDSVVQSYKKKNGRYI